MRGWDIVDTMLGVVFKGEGKFSLEQRPVPKCTRADDVLIEVESASICGTDVQILKVPPGHPANEDVILGHEYTGKVIEVGEAVTSVEVGDRVVIDPNITCGTCRYCKIGQPNMCENMTTLGIFIDGGFAKYNVAPQKALHKIPSTLPSEIAVFAEPLSCVVNGIQKIRPAAGESAIVLGAGPIGLYYTALLKASGLKVIVSEISEFRSKFARKMGADVIVNPQEESLEKRVMEVTEIGADIVVDAVGILLPDALTLVRRGGRILAFGMNKAVEQHLHQYDITRKEVTIFGTFIAKFTFPATIKILSSNILPLRELITHDIPLSDFKVGMDAMRKGEAVEVVLRP